MSDLKKLADALSSPDRWTKLTDAECDAAAAALRSVAATQRVPDDMVAVPRSALRWLFGEEGEFECPPERYFRGKPPAYWWRSVFRDKIAAPPAPAAEPARSAFEKWTRADGGNLTRHADDADRYASATVQGRWRAWKAAWDFQQPAPAAEPADFEKWLRTVCFQAPTKEAYDLAKDAWAAARADQARKGGE